MKNLPKLLIYFIACLLLSSAWQVSAADAPPVAELRKLYASDPSFKVTMDEALKHIKSPYNGAANPWQGKSFDDFCTFFNEWYVLLPVNGKNPPSSFFPPGQKVDEFNYITMFGGFYYENLPAQKIVGQDPGLAWTRTFVSERGKFMDSKLSTGTIQQWEDDPSIHINEYIIPEGGFQSFNQFFTHDLKPGARTIANPKDDSVLVAPTDCVLNMIQPLTADTKIPTKYNQKLDVKALLNGSPYAKYFANGTAISCILLPNTYHHYHAVTSGKVVESEQDIAGQYSGIWNFPAFLNNGNIGYGQSYSVFEHFRRGYAVIETKEYGHVAMVPVGLDTIGSVVFEDKYKKVASTSPVAIHKGDKLGYFAYGGSMVITLIESKASAPSPSRWASKLACLAARRRRSSRV